ncbi:unnamed protein product [Somion occarium]
MSRIAFLLPPLLSTQRSSWEQGIASQALLETYTQHTLPSDHGLPDLLPYLHGFVHDAIVRQADDGRLAVALNGDGTSDPGAADPTCIGETLYYLLRKFPTEVDFNRLISAVERMLDYVLKTCPRAVVEQIVNRNPSQDDLLLSHRIDALQIWSDTVYMLPPFLAAAAVYYTQHPNPQYDPPSLLRMAIQQVILAATALQSSDGEWSHIYDLTERKFQRKGFWGVGNGWVCGGIIRIFRTLVSSLLPGNEQLKDILLNTEVADRLKRCYDLLTHTLKACLHHIRPDGLFHDVLDDPSSFVETNLSQQLSYSLYRLLHLHLHTPPHIRDALHLPDVSKEQTDRWAALAGQLREAAIKKTDTLG